MTTSFLRTAFVYLILFETIGTNCRSKDPVAQVFHFYCHKSNYVYLLMIKLLAIQDLLQIQYQTFGLLYQLVYLQVNFQQHQCVMIGYVDVGKVGVEKCGCG